MEVESQRIKSPLGHGAPQLAFPLASATLVISFISVQPELRMTNCSELSGTEEGFPRMQDFQC